MPTVAVIGGGVTGLGAAYRLMQLGVTPVLYEATGRVGGVIETERREGYLAELGPNTMTGASPPVAELIAELGLADRQVTAPPAMAKRYVVRRGRLVRLPMSPSQLLTSRLLSNTAKLAVFGEPLIEPADSPIEESVAAFVRRRFNQEVLDYAANPFVAGVFAGNPEQLSMRHAFPKLHALETSQGSLIKAVMQMAKARRQTEEHALPAAAPISFRDGLQELPQAFARALGDRIRLRSPVTHVERDDVRWTVTASGETATYDAVVYTAPTYCVNGIDFEIVGGERLHTLTSIAYPTVAVLALGFPRDEVTHPLDGFGFLVPEVERHYVLGVLFSSSLFPDRAPEGYVMLTAFIGGTRDPQFAEFDEHTLTARVLDDLRGLLGVRSEPTFRALRVWPHAIPQYVLGYGRFKDLMDELERRNPGLAFAGAYRDGIALGEALLSGEQAAARVAESLAARESA